MATAVLVLATVTTGLMAGLYLGFSVAVIPALARVDDATFVRVMQRVNDAIQNPLFGLVFVGALVAGGAAAWWHLDRGDMRWWVLAGAVGYAVTVAVTVAANVPLNNRLDRAGPVERLADPRATRQDFERPWVRWHTLRTSVCVLAFGCLCVALSVA